MPCLMTRRDLVLGSAVTGLGAGLAPIRTAAAVPQDPTVGRTLVFEDRFEALDWSIWNAGPKATTFDTGFYGRAAFARTGGEEGVDPYAVVEDQNATGGKALQISATFVGRAMNVPSYYGNVDPEFQWISGNIQTARRDGTIITGWRKGYLEARMLFPEHPLTWPAFWLMNGRSILHPQTSIEIDIVEHKGWEPKTYGTYLHEWGQPGEHHESTGVQTPVDLTKAYHRYGVLITDKVCTPYFERRPVIDTKTGAPAKWTIKRSAEMDENGDVFWPLLSLALRTDVPFPQPLLGRHTSAQMRIDYFQVYA
jgi:hypothetical protein